ncbi:MAG: putative colanic acid biosynthesis acetyltransferase [Puniceicoccaceae bacterium]
MNREDIFSTQLHRANENYDSAEYGKRILWMAIRPILRLVPRFFYGFRNALLRSFGAKIGQAVRIYPDVDIFFPWNLEIGDEVTIGPRVQLYSLGKIIIGDGTMISYGAHFCAGTHDYTQVNLPLLKPEIRLGQGIWVCADAFVGPGVEIGDFSIVGARSVVLKSFPALTILGGNPARKIKDRPLPESAEQSDS